MIKIELSQTIQLIYYLFIIIALVLGSIEGWYYKISWFDLFVHFLSGVITSVLSLIIIKKIHLLTIEHTAFIILFMISFTLFVASSWEFFEFFSDKILKGDAQWVALTGVDDTMTDMLIALLGSIGFSIYYLTQIKFNGKIFLKQLTKVL
ncbi:MAG: DUF2238 domain-containing protein [bacterium]|nr:DUF2238 domain-containing protein [bacterium]